MRTQEVYCVEYAAMLEDMIGAGSEPDHEAVPVLADVLGLLGVVAPEAM